MSAALSISSSEIYNLSQQIALLGHNIANAGTPGYAVEDIPQTSLQAGGVGMGAANGLTQRAVDQQGQAAVLAQNGDVASLQTQQAALQQIDAAQGAVGSGTDIGSLLGGLANAYSALAANPANTAQQQAAVGAAQALATQINTVSNAIGTARQTAQDSIVSGVATLNSTLSALGDLSSKIVLARAQGQSTADLENQRAAAMDSLSQQISVKFYEQPDGDLLAVTQSGLNLPLHGPANPFSTSAATVAPSEYAGGGGLPGIALDGRDVTQQIAGGTLGANVQLRDSTLPAAQANIDEFAYTLASRFDAQGMTLFTDASGQVPQASATPPVQAGYTGFASSIQVNPAVLANVALVRDGTHAVTASGSLTAFTPNPPGGPAGFTGGILRVLTYALGSQSAPGVAQTPPSTTGLGPTGTINAGFAAPADLAGLAAAVTGAQAQTSATVTEQLTGAQSVQSTLQTAFNAATSVSIDTEMSKMIALQNAYGANARVMSAVQSMWAQLLQSVS